MTTEPVTDDDTERKKNRYHFDRHTPEYREQFADVTAEMLDKCPVAWSDTYGGHWVAAGHSRGVRAGPVGRVPVQRPRPGSTSGAATRASRSRRLTWGSAAASWRWTRPSSGTTGSCSTRTCRRPRWPGGRPLVDELVRASLNEKIETGRIDFVDDLANIVPAVLTLAMLGMPLKNWDIYVEPVHASVYTPPNSPDIARIQASTDRHARRHDRPARGDQGEPAARADRRARAGGDQRHRAAGLRAARGDRAAHRRRVRHHHRADRARPGVAFEHPSERERLSRERDTLLDSATEEFLRYFTPAPGDGRTISADCEIAGQQFKEGERLWLSWAMSNRDPAVFPNPNEVDLARTGNRHHSFGLGIHRCIGSNVARMVFKRMLARGARPDAGLTSATPRAPSTTRRSASSRA